MDKIYIMFPMPQLEVAGGIMTLTYCKSEKISMTKKLQKQNTEWAAWFP